MQEIRLGKVGIPACDGSIRSDVVIINDLIYKVEILQGAATYVKCIGMPGVAIVPNAHVLRTIVLWAGRDSYADMSLQEFVKRVLPQEFNNAR